MIQHHEPAIILESRIEIYKDIHKEKDVEGQVEVSNPVHLTTWADKYKFKRNLSWSQMHVWINLRYE